MDPTEYTFATEYSSATKYIPLWMHFPQILQFSPKYLSTIRFELITTFLKHSRYSSQNYSTYLNSIVKFWIEFWKKLLLYLLAPPYQHEAQTYYETNNNFFNLHYCFMKRLHQRNFILHKMMYIIWKKKQHLLRRRRCWIVLQSEEGYGKLIKNRRCLM